MVAFNASAAVSGDSSVNMSAVVNISSDVTCALTVSKPGNTALTANWTRKAGDNPESTFVNTTADKNPMYISVAASGASNCALNNMKIITSTTAQNISGSVGQGSKWFHVVNFGSLNGAWKFAPFLTDLKLYTDNHYGVAGSGNITITNANGSPLTVQSTVKAHEGSIDSEKYRMTDSYIVGGAFNMGDMLMHNSLTGTITFSTDSAAEMYKSAKIGVGAVLGTDPIVRNTATVDKTVAANGDVATMNWTVTISEA
ncbi:TPA: hypothetical protein I3599_004579 [Enterobacter cloacae]|nr:hypothetical protein [Enterobacter cloacae]